MSTAEPAVAERLRPSDPQQVADIVAWAVAEGTGLEVIGGGTKRGLGRPARPVHVLDVSGVAGITNYEPAELVLTAAAATPMSEIEAAVAANSQMLAFEPGDLGLLYGVAAGGATLAGVVACNLSGPRRVKAGAARDHLLGFDAVNGRGERFKAGGRVVKNVTGYDLCKLLAGSYGTLAVLTELTVKVLPAPEKTRTVLVYGLDDVGASAAMTAALGSSHEVSGAAHLPAPIAATSAVDYVAGAGQAVTALRVEGVAPSVVARCAALMAELAGFGPVEELHGTNSMTLWAALRDVAPFVGGGHSLWGGHTIWRLSVPPRAGHAVVAAILRDRAGVAYYDWGGGLIWLALDPASVDAGAVGVRAAVALHGGHATLVRAPDAVREAVAVFEPQPDGLARLTERVKDGFDPRRVLNPGRMYEGV